MQPNQIVIQVLLIAVFAIFVIVLLLPVRGARRLAVRRLTLAGAFVAAILAVIFPSTLNDIANAVGVGRGTDLVLYGLVVVFIGNSIASAALSRQQHREITRLARAIAIRDATDKFDPPARPADTVE